ncbi:MAG: hypothetical protein IH947_03530, partial [Bacteroidetes bacterium]|nr:hypothetical protein [Bacteroidota bacterium]
MNKTFLVIKREYLTRVKKKSFLLTTILTPLIFPAILGAIIYFAVKEKDSAEKQVIEILNKSGKIKLSKDFAGYTVKLANPSLSDMLLDLYGPRKSVGIYNKMRQAKFVWKILKDPIIKKVLGEKRHHEYKTALRRYTLSKIPLVNLSSPDFYVNTKEIEDIIGVVSQKYQDSPFKIKIKLEHNQYSRMDDIDGPGDLIRAEMMFNLMEAASELYKVKSKFENKEDY